eukprot:2909705-Pleurochrysis_carterae.AAC.2
MLTLSKVRPAGEASSGEGAGGEGGSDGGTSASSWSQRARRTRCCARAADRCSDGIEPVRSGPEGGDGTYPSLAAAASACVVVRCG